MERGPVVVRADDPRRAELEARGWHVTARSWGAQLDRRVSDSASLRDLVARVVDVAAVRELGEGDAPAVLALDAATRDDYPGGVATAHRPLTRDRATPGPSRRAFGALASGELVAMTFVDVDGSRAETDFTAVATPWRGRGLGTAVKAASVLMLVAEGVTRFRTGGSVDNGSSVAMNRRVGYVLDEEWITMAPPTGTETPSAPGAPWSRSGCRCSPWPRLRSRPRSRARSPHSRGRPSPRPRPGGSAGSSPRVGRRNRRRGADPRGPQEGW